MTHDSFINEIGKNKIKLQPNLKEIYILVANSTYPFAC